MKRWSFSYDLSLRLCLGIAFTRFRFLHPYMNITTMWFGPLACSFTWYTEPVPDWYSEHYKGYL